VLRWSRSLNEGDLEFWQTLDRADFRSEENPLADEHPLDRIPTLTPWEVPTWEAYQHLIYFADGSGGFSVAALEHYFLPPQDGSRLETKEQNRVRKLIPVLIREDSKIAREEAEIRRKAAKVKKK
jgi:hypothetical protein